ncbi:MAG: lysophospholipid acyltransferase family protein [Nonlabens sp.]
MESNLYHLFYPILWLLSKLPFTIVYLISDFVYLILYYIVGYRKETIRKNLKIAFPDKSDQEIKSLHKKNMQHFCDMFMEMIKSLGMSKAEMQKRFTCENIDLVNQFADKGKPIICMFGHQASYEWTMVLTDQMKFPVYAVYKPLKDKKFDGLIRRIRMRFGAQMIAMKQANHKIAETAKTGNALFALVADQAPKQGRSKYFTEFFDKPTAVFKGGERFGKEFNAVIVFLRVTKIKRGYYSSRYELITNQGTTTDDWHITDRFFELLEDQIKKQPAFYLWSHKRWRVISKKKLEAGRFSPKLAQKPK